MTDPRSIVHKAIPVPIDQGSGSSNGYLPGGSKSYLLLPVQVPLRFIVLSGDKSSNEANKINIGIYGIMSIT